MWGLKQETRVEAAMMSRRQRMEVVPEWEQRRRERWLHSGYNLKIPDKGS